MQFGEVQSRIVVSARPGDVEKVKEMAEGARVPVTELGVVGGERFRIGVDIDLPLNEVAETWRNGLPKAMHQ